MKIMKKYQQISYVQPNIRKTARQIKEEDPRAFKIYHQRKQRMLEVLRREFASNLRNQI